MSMILVRVPAARSPSLQDRRSTYPTDGYLDPSSQEPAVKKRRAELIPNSTSEEVLTYLRQKCTSSSPSMYVLGADFVRRCEAVSSASVEIARLLETVAQDCRLLVDASRRALAAITASPGISAFCEIVSSKSGHAALSPVERLITALVITCDPRCGLEGRGSGDSCFLSSVEPVHGTPLALATFYGCTDIMRALLALGSDINAQHATTGTTPLGVAIERENGAAAALLISNGAAVSIQLHDAAQKNFIPGMVLLCDSGADVDGTTTDNGFTPLHHAAEAGSGQAASLLLDQGAAINARSHDGRTPLHCAVQNTSLTANYAMACLIQRRCDVQVRTLSGDTPLHYACKLGNCSVLEVLVFEGADTFARDKDGNYPWDLFYTYFNSARYDPNYLPRPPYHLEARRLMCLLPKVW